MATTVPPPARTCALSKVVAGIDTVADRFDARQYMVGVDAGATCFGSARLCNIGDVCDGHVPTRPPAVCALHSRRSKLHVVAYFCIFQECYNQVIGGGTILGRSSCSTHMPPLLQSQRTVATFVAFNIHVKNHHCNVCSIVASCPMSVLLQLVKDTMLMQTCSHPSVLAGPVTSLARNSHPLGSA